MASSRPDDPTTPKASKPDAPTTPKTPTSKSISHPAGEPSLQSIPPGDAPSLVWGGSDADATGRTSPGGGALRPFARYNVFACETLEQLIRTQLHPGPEFSKDSPDFLSSTKGMNLTERDLVEEEQLTRIVFAPTMLWPLMTRVKAALSSFRLDFQYLLHTDFAVAVSPWHTSVGLTDVVFSEKDVEDWVVRVILVPALHVVLALRQRSIPVLQRGVGSFLNRTAEERGPYISSAPQEDVIPDAIVVDIGKKVKATVEVKPQNVLEQGCSRVTVQGEMILSPLLQMHKDTNKKSLPGRAIKFNWPSPDEKSPDAQTRILVQMFTQLSATGCDLGMLSSYFLSLFYFRDGQTLFITHEYASDEEILLATIAWMAMVLEIPGFEKTNMDLPDVDDSWWGPNVYRVEASGVVAPTLPVPPTVTSTRSRR